MGKKKGMKNGKGVQQRVQRGPGSSTLATTMRSSYRGGFSDSSRVTLRYVTTVSMNTSGSGVTGANYNFRGNGPFDPDFTGTGGQPANYDDFVFQYNRYRVWGSKVTFNLQSALSSPILQLVVVPSQTTFTGTTLTQIQNLQSSPYAKSYSFGANTSQFKPNGFVQSISTPKLFGATPDAVVANPDLSALISANPAIQWYWNFALYDVSQSLTSAQYMTVFVDYDVEFFERIPTTLDLDARILRLKDMRETQKLLDHEKKEDQKSDESMVFVREPLSRQPTTASTIEERTRLWGTPQGEGPVFSSRVSKRV